MCCLSPLYVNNIPSSYKGQSSREAFTTIPKTHQLESTIQNSQIPLTCSIGPLAAQSRELKHPYFWGSDPIGNKPKECIDQTLLYRLWVFAHPTVVRGIDDQVINALSDPTLSGLGCFKLMVCQLEKDQLTTSGLTYAEKVKESGWKGEIEVVVVDDEDHCFHIFDPETEKAKDMICHIANIISRICFMILVSGGGGGPSFIEVAGTEMYVGTIFKIWDYRR
ncbi:alpha/beta-Hydrolases superfamily protein [Striga asiatica]|uniref:Alpha/beta-Hydrolases superfamily protein n=1 Tax=Striga asiatica TaxID=4170 RepID=A0A5A7PEL0_STRAF|nr:alpha/beta-Hydrolases superfamily protein [Striga asiatica]